MEWRKEDKEALRAQRWFPAFQARLGGDATAQFKGMLCYAPVKRPLLPKSMCKSFGEGEDGAAPTGSGIMALEQNTGGRCERPKSGFLCRQSVSALQRAGVPTNVFLELQQEHFDGIRNAFTSESRQPAFDLFERLGGGHTVGRGGGDASSDESIPHHLYAVGSRDAAWISLIKHKLWDKVNRLLAGTKILFGIRQFAFCVAFTLSSCSTVPAHRERRRDETAASNAVQVREDNT